MFGDINEICNTESFTWQKTEIPLDWNNASFFDKAANYNPGEMSKMGGAGVNSLTVDTGASTSSSNSSIAAATLTPASQVFTDPNQKALELSFRVDLSTLPYSTRIAYKYGELLFGFAFNKATFFKDPAVINTNSSTYDATHELVEAFTGSEQLFLMRLSRYAASDNMYLDFAGSFTELTGVNNNSAKTQKNSGSSITDSLQPFDGVKTVTLRLEVGLGNVLSILVLVDGELYQHFTTTCAVDTSFLNNASITPVFLNFYRGSGATYQITDISLHQLSLPDNHGIKDTSLMQRDFSTSRVKAVMGKDLAVSGQLFLETVSDGIELFKTFLTGSGYHGNGGCNWELVFEDSTSIVVRAKTGNRNYFKLSFSDSAISEIALLFVKVQAYTFMSDINTGDFLVTNPAISNATLVLPKHRRSSYSDGSGSNDSYKSLNYQALLREDFLLVASDKSLIAVSNGLFVSNAGKTETPSFLGGFGEYASIIPDYSEAIFVYSSINSTSVGYSLGVNPSTHSSDKHLATRGIEGTEVDRLIQNRSTDISVEGSITFNSDITGGPVMFSQYIGTQYMTVGVFPGIKCPLNRYPGSSSLDTVDIEFVSDMPPCGELFSVGELDYVWWYGSAGNATTYTYRQSSFSTVAISLNDEDWV